MKWRGRRSSSNVDDARGRQALGGTGGAGTLLNLVGRRFGIKGILVVLVLGFAAVKMGLIDPAGLTGGPTQSQSVPVEVTPAEQERFEFIAVVLADTEDVWKAEFDGRGATYQEPVLVIYRNQQPTGCGMGQAQMGPFYCPADRKVYIDLGFYDELEKTFQAPGDFAQAYVIAHEIGHHIQNLLGTSDRVHAMRGRPDYNEFSVRLELQADFLAGVWAHHNQRFLDKGDIEEAIRAANTIGDDVIQARTQGKTVPHTFTHGTAEQRTRWFEKGLRSGQIEDGDTFAMPYSQL